MIGLSPNGVKIMIATQPVDFRRGMNGLVALVASALSADPYCGDVFVFRAKRCDRLRCIYWDGSGMIWPPIRDGAMQMSSQEFSLLLAGIDWTRVKRNVVKRPTKAG